MTNATIATLAALAIDPLRPHYSITSWLVPHTFEDHEGSIEVYSVAYTFGSRVFVHCTPYRDCDLAEKLLVRIRDFAPSIEHILGSPHWHPHPYCDGTLEERLTVEAEVEAHERAAYRGGYHCDSDKAREIAKSSIIETSLPSPPSNDWNWAADRAATHANGHHGENS